MPLLNTWLVCGAFKSATYVRFYALYQMIVLALATLVCPQMVTRFQEVNSTPKQDSIVMPPVVKLASPSTGMKRR